MLRKYVVALFVEAFTRWKTWNTIVKNLIVIATAAAFSGIAWLAGAAESEAVPVFLSIGLIVLIVIVAPYRVWRAEVERVEALEERLKSTLTFQDHGTNCCQEGDDGKAGRYRLRRVVLVNDGESAATGVRVSLVKIHPLVGDVNQRLPLPLRPQHSPHAKSDYGLTIAGKAEQAFDVYQTWDQEERGLSVCHTVRGAVGSIPWAEYRLHLQVVSDNAPTVTRVARVVVTQTEASLKFIE